MSSWVQTCLPGDPATSVTIATYWKLVKQQTLVFSVSPSQKNTNAENCYNIISLSLFLPHYFLSLSFSLPPSLSHLHHSIGQQQSSVQPAQLCLGNGQGLLQISFYLRNKIEFALWFAYLETVNLVFSGKDLLFPACCRLTSGWTYWIL